MGNFCCQKARQQNEKQNNTPTTKFFENTSNSTLFQNAFPLPSNFCTDVTKNATKNATTTSPATSYSSTTVTTTSPATSNFCTNVTTNVTTTSPATSTSHSTSHSCSNAVDHSKPPSYESIYANSSSHFSLSGNVSSQEIRDKG